MDEDGLYSDARLRFSMVDHPYLKFSFNIEIEILPCIVEKASFAVSSYALAYNIGDLDYYYKLPKIIQQPACE